ncbi:hypothetical protein SLEP1_g45921 [Rubroshorea leprosula]|uniref:Uncharacterized protein n=1 Tax=Rubroshorea leprosula TaxID=152421 RepID=A0AAV5LMF0_9ROSI|nr:hypothetical protein SLEP1_g45921 [Rubroshorea leprosula]
MAGRGKKKRTGADEAENRLGSGLEFGASNSLSQPRNSKSVLLFLPLSAGLCCVRLSSVFARESPAELPPTSSLR